MAPAHPESVGGASAVPQAVGLIDVFGFNVIGNAS